MTRTTPLSLASKLIRGGLPNVAAGLLAITVPILGVAVLPSEEYVVWALASTLITISLVFDFGAPVLATSLASKGEATLSVLARLSLATSIPPLTLSFISVVMWPSFADRAGIEFEQATIAPLFFAIGAGTALRSISLVLAGVELGKERYQQRAAVILSGAVVNVATVTVLLEAGIGLATLGYATLLAGLTQFVLALGSVRRSVDPPDTSGVQTLLPAIRMFLASKGVVALLGLSITQLDRWLIALIAEPGFLAAYDIAARLAVAPKVALIAFSVGLVSELGQSDYASHKKRRIYSKWTILTLLVYAMTSAVVAAVLLLSGDEGKRYWQIPLLVTLAQAASSLTIPYVMYLAAIRRPHIELYYIAPLAALTYAGYALGIYMNSAGLLVFLTTASMTVMSIGFALTGYTKIGKS